jgi:ABC-type transporter Mla MlaB component
MKIAFLADFFVEDGINGGGELNNDELIKLLINKGNEVDKLHTHNLQIQSLPSKDTKLIIGNFVALPEDTRHYIIKNYSYIIYEHDHKYLKTRDPSLFKNYKAPEDQIVNKEFYQSAKAVICQSKLHMRVVERNLNLDNIVSVSGNLWSEELLDYLEQISTSQEDKEDVCSIMHSSIPNKNLEGSILYCRINELKSEKIMPCSHKEFLTKLNKNKTLVFFPKTLETLSRIVVEARMLNCRVVTNKKIGATSEDWFKLKGKPLIEKMREKRLQIPEIVLKYLA